MWCSNCGSDKHLVGKCPRKAADLSQTEIVREEGTPKQQLIGECDDSCPYREDAEKWRRQQERKKADMRRRRKVIQLMIEHAQHEMEKQRVANGGPETIPFKRPPLS